MDAIVERVEPDADARPSRAEAEAAVATLLRYIGEEPRRDGLAATPRRLVESWDELFSGYRRDADEVLARTFDDAEGYDDLVVLRDVPFRSHCEHHVLPILGTADIAYLPAGRVVGLSKLARVVDIYARRLQIQERLTIQIARTVQDALEPRGVAVRVRAEHLCMSMRGIRQAGTSTVTRSFTGIFEEEPAMRQAFEAALQA